MTFATTLSPDIHSDAPSRRYSEFVDPNHAARPSPFDYRRALSMPLPSVSTRSSFCPFSSSSTRARPEQLAAVNAVPLNSLTLVEQQNDVMCSAFGDRLRNDENQNLFSNDDPFPIPPFSSSPSSMDPSPISVASPPPTSGLLLCAPIYDTPMCSSLSLENLSQNFGRVRFSRLYHTTRGSVDALVLEPEEPMEEMEKEKDKDKERRRSSVSWASVKESVAKVDLGNGFSNVLKRVKRVDTDSLDWFGSCEADYKYNEDEEEFRDGKWQSKLLNKMRKGMRRHTVLWRG